MPAGDREIALRWVASKVASRFLAAAMKHLAAWDMDMLARLSILEGAAGVPPGTWLRQKSRGFGSALDHFGPKLSAAWTTSRSQGVYDRAVAAATRMLSRSSGADPMDLVQDMVSGSTSSTGSARHRLFYSVGNALRKDESGLTSGDVTPNHRYVTGAIDRWVKRAALDVLDLARERRQQAPMKTWRAPGAGGGLNDTQRANLLLLALQRPGGPGNEVRRIIDQEIDRAFPPASRPIVRTFLQKIGEPKYHSPQEMKRLVSRFDPRKWFVQAVNLVRKEIMDELGLTPQQVTRALGGQAAHVFKFMRERVGKNPRVRKIIEELADEIELTEPGMAHTAEKRGQPKLEHAVLRRWLEKKEREANLTSGNAFAGTADEGDIEEGFEPNEYAQWGDAVTPYAHYSRGPSPLRVASAWMEARRR